MNWSGLLHCSWLDTRARFLAGTLKEGALLDLGWSDGKNAGARRRAASRGGLVVDLNAGFAARSVLPRQLFRQPERGHHA